MPKPTLLITSSMAKARYQELSGLADIYWLDELSEEKLDALIPSVDSLLVLGFWPRALTPERVSRMTRLRFLQSGMAGVNHIPLRQVAPGVTVSSNAGGFSQGVGEFAWGLLWAAAKRVAKLDGILRSGKFDESNWSGMARDVVVLQGKTLGVLGYGGIGRAVARMGFGFGMEVRAFGRHPDPEERVHVSQGREGLLQVLGASDAVVIALPLSKLTEGLLGPEELSAMKPNAILVNVARAEIVREAALYDRLVKFPSFVYATDVWRIEGGAESYSSEFPLLSLPNFIGTPHVAGAGSGQLGESTRSSIENLRHYLGGEAPRNVVDRSEYL